MSSLLAGAVWLGLVAWLLARAVSHFRAHAGTELRQQPSGLVPSVTVIVPARDEAENIQPCLAALSGQEGLGEYEILVVDDESRDGTGRIVQDCAAGDRRIRLIHAGPLPEGWAGKPHACWRGALAARGEWLCFIDADVRAEPGLLAAAARTSGAEGIDMLSLLPFQVLGSAWEWLIVPAGMVMIACAMDRGAVDDPASPAIAANGQFILVRRDAYFAVGGHASVRAAICEDKNLAEQVKNAGFRFRLLAADRLARTRMYRDLPSLWEGFSKNAVDILGSAGTTLAAATAGMLAAWTAALLPVELGIQAALDDTSLLAWAGAGLAACGSGIVAAVSLGTCRHVRAPPAFALLFPLGATLCAVLAWRSALLRRHGEVAWKGRRYGTRRRLPTGLR
jgi:chlorobactene glucosyltransferase